MKELDHENIIRTYDIINDDDNHCVFYLFEYFPSKNLYDLIKTNQILTQVQIKHIIAKVLLALQHLHQKNICHRDLTLSNVLVCNDIKIVKIIDFGVAKEVNKSTNAMVSPAGKWVNLPPEFETEGCYTIKYDIWLVGLILLQLLYRTTIFSKKAIQIVKSLKKNDKKYDDIAILDEDCKDLIGKLLEDNPEKRLNAIDAFSHKWLSSQTQNVS